MTKSPDDIFGTVAAKLLHLVKLTGESQVTFRLGEIASDIEIEFDNTQRVLKRLVEKDKAIKILGLHFSNPDRRYVDIEDVPTDELERAMTGQGRTKEEQSAWATKEVLGAGYSYDYHDQITVDVDSDALKKAIRNFGAAEKTFSQNMMEGAIRTIQEQQDAIKTVQWERGVVPSNKSEKSESDLAKPKPVYHVPESPGQIKAALDQRYKSIIEYADSNWNFFLFIADYMFLVDQTKGMSEILELIKEERADDFKRLQELEIKLLKEVEEARTRLITLIGDKEIPTELVKKNLQEYNDYKAKKILSSQPLVEALFENLSEAVRTLFYKGYVEELEGYIEVEQGDRPEIRRFTFAPTLDSYFQEKEEVEGRKKTSLWFAWNELGLVYLCVYRAKEHSEFLYKEGRKWEILNFHGVVQEMRDIRDRKDFAQHQPVQFIRSEYQPYIHRIHAFFIEQLASREESEKRLREDLKHSQEQQDAARKAYKEDYDVFGNRRDAQRDFRLDEGQKLAIEASERQLQRSLEEKRHREDMQLQRMLRTTEDKRVHAINKILERIANVKGEHKGTTINFLDFNFGNTNDDYLQVFRPFLEELQAAGGFVSFQRGHAAPSQANVSFEDVNPEKLTEFRDKITPAQVVAPTLQAIKRDAIKKALTEPHEGAKEDSPAQAQKSRPYCVVEGKWGYLKADGKFGKKTKIGKSEARPFRLLQCVFEPFGVAKTVDAVFDAIRLPKDAKDTSLNSYDAYKKRGRQIEIIKYTIKELQKGSKLGNVQIKVMDDGKVLASVS